LNVAQHSFRRLWADYFDSQGLRYAFFSALNAAALQEARREALEAAQLAKELEQAKQSREEGQEDGNDDDDDDNEEEEAEADAQAEHQTTSSSEEDESENDSVRFDLGDSEDDTDPRVRVLSVLELEDLFKSAAPELACE
jgi:large subunit GTPase 1